MRAEAASALPPGAAKPLIIDGAYRQIESGKVNKESVYDDRKHHGKQHPRQFDNCRT